MFVILIARAGCGIQSIRNFVFHCHSDPRLLPLCGSSGSSQSRAEEWRTGHKSLLARPGGGGIASALISLADLT